MPFPYDGPRIDFRARCAFQIFVTPETRANLKIVQTGTSMYDLKLEDCGRLLLRLSIGGMMVFHGFEKLTGGVDGIAEARWIWYSAERLQL